MKKVEVVNPFEDKNVRGKFYLPGQEIEFEVSRADDLIRRGLAKEAKEESKKK